MCIISKSESKSLVSTGYVFLVFKSKPFEPVATLTIWSKEYFNAQMHNV